jgi:hypothetical protein
MDPAESNDLSAVRSDLTDLGRRRLAAWVQYQAKFYEPLLGNKAWN